MAEIARCVNERTHTLVGGEVRVYRTEKVYARTRRNNVAFEDVELWLDSGEELAAYAKKSRISAAGLQRAALRYLREKLWPARGDILPGGV